MIKENILLLSIIIKDFFYKIILSVYAILIKENKQWTFSLIHLKKHN